MRRVRPVVLAVAALVLASACSGGEDERTVDGEPRIVTTQLPELVLQPEDVPDDLVRFDEGRLARADIGGSDPARFGREGGWKARYKSDDPEAEGPLVVESRVDLFADEAGAEQDFEELRQELLGDERVDAPDVGDETVAVTRTQQAFPENVRFYVVAWRQDNVTATVNVQGFEDRLGLEDAVALARTMEAHIERAAAGDAQQAETATGAATATLAVVSSEPPSVEGAGFASNERVTLVFELADGELRREIQANANGVFARDVTELERDRCTSAVIVIATGETSGARASVKLPALQCPPPP